MTERQYIQLLHNLLDEIFEIETFATDTQFAKAAKLSGATVSRLRSHTTRFPRLQTVMKLANAVGMRIVVSADRRTLRKAA